MPVVKTPRAIIEVLDSEGQVTGFEIENFYTFDGPESQHFTPKVQRDEATPEEVEKLRGKSDAGLTETCQKMNQQIAELIDENNTKSKELARIPELEAQLQDAIEKNKKLTEGWDILRKRLERVREALEK